MYVLSLAAPPRPGAAKDEWLLLSHGCPQSTHNAFSCRGTCLVGCRFQMTLSLILAKPRLESLSYQPRQPRQPLAFSFLLPASVVSLSATCLSKQVGHLRINILGYTQASSCCTSCPGKSMAPSTNATSGSRLSSSQSQSCITMVSGWPGLHIALVDL
jgi:hypothetical protein